MRRFWALLAALWLVPVLAFAQVPAAVRAPLFAARARPTVSLDFAHGAYRLNGQSYSTPSAIPGWSFTRASTGYAQNSSGALVSFGSGVPRITDLGLLDELAATNVIPWSQDATQWANEKGGVALLATITGNAGIAPDGTLTASRIQMTLNGGSTTGDFVIIEPNGTVTTGSQVTSSVWLKSNTGSTYTLRRWDANKAAQDLITVTPTWQRFLVTTASTGGPNPGVIFGLRGTFSSASADVLVWGAQLEVGAVATSYIPTASTSATRAADALTLTYSPNGSTATVNYGTNSTASVSPTSPINLGSSSGGAWVGNYVRKLVVTP